MLKWSGSPKASGVVFLKERLAIMLPKKMIIVMMIMFKIEIPRICLQTWLLRIFIPPSFGLPLMMDLSGGSVARARAAKVSIIKLIHNKPTGEIGDSAKKQEPINTV